MLTVAQAHDLRRIIVVLPYTNIISQTVNVLRKAVVLDGEVPEEIVAEHHHQADFENFGSRHLASFSGSKIVVFNTIQNAAVFAQYMRNSGLDVLHLSSALTPEDKECTINEITRRQKPENCYPENWTLIATSCVECGMNFSFHYGFCELRSLQSYFQLAGRVSRDYEWPDGMLTAFTITEDNFTANTEFEVAQGIFKKMISDKILQTVSDVQAVSHAFFEECKKGETLSADICKADKMRKFATVSMKFHVIEEETITVVASQKLAKKSVQGKQFQPENFKGAV